MTAVYTRFAVLVVVAVLFAGSVPTIGVATSAAYSERTGSENQFSEISVTGTQATGDFVVGKFDSDDDSDLLVFDGSTERYYEQTSPGEYVQRTGPANPFSDVESAFGTRGRSFVADVDGDGYDDIITYNTSSDTFRYVAHNQSAGSYEARTGTDNPFDGITASGNQQTVDAILGDFDGDGDPDLLAFDGSERYFENDGGTYIERTGSENPFAGILEPAFWTRTTTLVRDFDGDGDVDIAWQNGTPGDWTYIENLDSGGYEVRSGENNPLTGVSASATGGGLAAVADDFDGDDEIEVLANDSTVRYYDRNATGQYSQVTGSKNPFSGVSPAFGVFGTTVTTDLDADSDRDLLWYDDGSLRYVEYTGTVGVPDATTVSVDTHPTDSTAGDAIGGPPRANVTDKFGNPVDGVAVTVAEEGGYGFDSGTTTNTTTNGITTFDDLYINESADDYQLNFSISATDGSVDTSANTLTETFNVTAADANSLQISETPESVDAGAEFNMTINATDDFGNPAADQTLSDLTVDSEFDGTVLGPLAVTLNETGAYEVTIPADEVTTANESHTLTATADGLTADSLDITVEPANATTVSVDSQPVDTTAGEAIAGPPRANVTDKFGNPVDGVTVTVAEEGGYTFDSGTLTNTTTEGTTTFDDLIINDSATGYQLNVSISAADPGVNVGASAQTDLFNVTAADADSLQIIDAPKSVDAGESFTLTINATDEFDNLAADGTLSDITVDSEFEGRVFGPSSVRLNETGAAEVSIDADELTTAAESHRLTATANGLSDDSVDLTVDSAAATAVSVETLPTDTTAGEAIAGPPQANVTDQFGNPVDGVSVTVSEEGGYSFDSGTTTNTTTDGSTTFDDLFINQSATGYQLNLSVSATDAGVDASTSTLTKSFNVTAADATSLRIIDAPDSVDAGESFNVTINATDEFDNLAVGQSLTNITVSSEFEGRVFGPTNITLNDTAAARLMVGADEVTTGNDSHTLTATADSFTDDSVDIRVNTTDANTLTVDRQPASTTANESIDGQPTVSVTDASGNRLSDVTLTASLNGSTGLLGTTAVETNHTGVATFDDLHVQEVGSYNLTFEVGGDSTVNATTAPFEITAATPDSVTVESQPADTTAGESIAGPPTANVTDAFGNPVTDENVTVTINGSTTLWGSTEIETDDTGIATFGDLTVTDTGRYDLTFELTDDGSVTTTTDAFEIISADGKSITVDIQPIETTANESINGPPTLTVTDEFGNPVEGVDVTATLNDSGLQGTTTVSTNDTGLAVFDALRVKTAGEYNLTFELTADSSVNATTDTFEITAATPDSVDAADTADTAGVEGTINVTLTDAFDNQVDGATINATDADGLGNLSETATTNETGVAAFTFNETTTDSYTPTFELDTAGTITDTATVNVDPAAPETVTATANDLTHTVSDDFTDDNALVVTVTVTDAFDNRVPGVTVNVTDNGTDIAVRNGRSRSTDANGQVAFEIQSTTIQSAVEFEFAEKATGDENAARIEGVAFEGAELGARGSASSYTVSTGTEITFRANDSTIPNGSNPHYEWTWDNGTSTRTGTGITNTTSFGLPGTINTTLNVTVAGENTTDEFAVTIEDRRDPEARLTAPETVGVGSSFTLDASASTDNVEIADYEWAFGNGTTANGSALDQPTGNYSAPGEYTVELVVTDTSGYTDTNTTTIVAKGANASLLTVGRAFGDVGMNSTATQSVDIANDGTIALNVTDTTISGTDASAFSLLGDEEPRVRPDENRSLVVGFTPETTGTKTATLDITTENNTGPNSFKIDLRGEGVASDLVPNESAVSFGTVDIGTTVEWNVTIDNDGGDAADLATAEFIGSAAEQFTVVDSLPTIPAGESANVTVAFDPEAVGDLRSTLSVESTDGDATQVALDGTGEGPLLSVPTTNRSVGSTGSGTETSSTAALRNYGSQPLNVSDLSLAGPDAGAFEIDTDPDSLVVAPGATESVVLTFAPETPGVSNASLVVAHNDTTTGDAAIGLTGQGLAADISVDRTTVDFGTTAVGSSDFQNVTLTNEGDSGANLTVDSTTIVGRNPEDFAVESPERPFVIEPGEERDLRVNFTAGGEGKRNAQLQLYSDAGNERQTNVWLANTRSYIIVEEISNPTVNVDGRNFDTGDENRVNVSTPSTRESNVTVVEISMEMKRDGGFEMNVVNNESAFDNAFPEGDDTELVQYVGIEHLDHDPNATFDNTSLAYQVDADSLPAGVESDEVALNRYNESREEYVELDTEFIEQRGDNLLYRVETPGFSEFAITAKDTDENDNNDGDDDTDDSDDGSTGSPGSSDRDDSTPRIEADDGEGDGGAYDTRFDVDAGPGETVDITGESAGTGETLSSVDTIAVDSLSLDVETDRPFSLDLSTYESDLTPSFDAERLDAATETRLRDAATEFESETGTVSAGYIDIEHDLAGDELSGATVGFEVSRSQLDDLGVEPEAVTLYRQTDDGWTPLSTEQADDTESHYRYAATTPGFSVFAIGTESPRFTVTEAELANSSITVGETATVTATVENRGQQSGEYTAELAADNETVDNETVHIEGQSSVTVELSFEPQSADDYALAVGETEAGGLTVDSRSQDTESTQDQDPDRPLGWVVVVVVACGLAVLVWRRRSQ